MNPFFFGTRDRRIFGVYEPAAFGTAGKRAAVICYPWGAEYLHAHRTMRQLALKLSLAGFHTLRFDYFGTGDSAGDMVDADLKGWESDVEMAIEEIKEMVGATEVTLVGLGKEVEALVLWDPIISGDEYLERLDVTDRSVPVVPEPERAQAAEAVEIRGFPLTGNMIEDLRSVGLSRLISEPVTRTLMLVTERSPLHSALSPLASGPFSGSLEIEYLGAVRPWIEDSANSGMVPFGVIQRIVNWLS